MKDTMPKIQPFYEICKEAEPKLHVLDYYPYGSKTEWEYWLCGKVDLKKQYLDKRYSKLTEKDLILKILNEVGRAMHYTIVWNGPENTDEPGKDWWLRQRIEAFNMWNLFTTGKIGWNKNLIKNKSIKEIEQLEEFHSKRLNIIYNDEREASILKNKKTKKEKDDYLKIIKKCVLNNRKEYGIYEVVHMPLMQNGTMKPLYTKQQLCAIWLLVQCAFENMC